MEKYRFDEIEILLVDPAASVRESLKNILHAQGFRRVQLGGSLQEIRERLINGTLDLLISEVELQDGDFCGLVTAIRHHELGSNPFLPVVALTWEPTPEKVRAIINAGVDNLLTKPLSIGQVVNHLIGLVRARKPFVVTSDYIGPERRKADDSRGTEIQRVEVPNVLKAKATSRKDAAVGIQEAINACFAEINVQKLERYAVQIGFLVDQTVPSLEAGTVDKTTEAFLDRLLYVAQDTARRLVGTKYAHVSNLCQSLIKVTGDIRKNVEKPETKNVQLLRPLAQAIQAGFEAADAMTAATARQISAHVDRH